LWWTKWHWDRFFSELSVFPCRFHSTGAPLIVKIGKKNCSSIYHHHWVCTKSLKAVVRGPFITNEKNKLKSKIIGSSHLQEEELREKEVHANY
jgi:hypothetical protein